jgi:tetraacyldisaccharide 4'-kinase
MAFALKPPAFWYEPPGLAASLLKPIAGAYGDRVAQRMALPGQRAGVPVLCVGNFTVGGAGKTPLALALAELLSEAGVKPAFLTRGYGGRDKGPTLVEPGARADTVGDEALLLAAEAPTVVSADRVAGAARAVAAGAEAIIMDDGFQNPSLVKDCSIVAVDGETGIGNGLAFPAGPLRAPIHAQMPYASAVVVIGAGDAGRRVADFARGSGVPAFRGRIGPEPAAPPLRGQRVLAFAGIGRPQKFFKTLADLGAIIAATEIFADHHPFSEADAMRIAERARAGRLIPVTTTKDRTRLIGGPAREALVQITEVVPVRLMLDDEAAMLAFLKEGLRIR